MGECGVLERRARVPKAIQDLNEVDFCHEEEGGHSPSWEELLQGLGNQIPVS